MAKQLFIINTKEELDKIIKANKGKLIIDFTSPTCGPCLMLEPILDKLIDNQICSVARIDVSENQELAYEFQIQATPTLILVKDSEIKKALVGYQPYEAWVEILNKI